ncbi:ABC transporter permease [Nesterenkonia flava]|uniref:ABC transporter permease n=1 Tax=Nesterenkonia flava TaxID=469799 RepID=A0ABU1FU05_9MICC|nr:ABC transporter permease [Nesterenkonia flava]MDR5712145.1 ABC transporter permease [Nesterenkonia flava]
MLRNLLALWSVRIAGAFLLLVLGLAIIGPVVAPFEPLERSPNILAHPSAEHWLGTDYMGRDVLSRILTGSTISVLGAVEVAVIALVLGALPGILSVYLGRVFEWVTLRVIDTLIALPFLVVAVAMTALLGNGVHQAMIAVGLLVSPVFYRVARAAALEAVSSQYVEAAVLSGASTWWVVRHHIWGKVLPALGVALANTMGAGLVVIASLTFIGIGVQPPEPTWGGVLASDLGYLHFRPYAPFFPIALIMATVWALNALADGIRDVSGESGQRLATRGKAVPSTVQKSVKAGEVNLR